MSTFKIILKLLWKLLNFLFNFVPQKKYEWVKFKNSIRNKAKKNKFLNGLLLISERFLLKKYFDKETILEKLPAHQRYFVFMLFFIPLSSSLSLILKKNLLTPLPEKSVSLLLLVLLSISLSILLYSSSNINPLLSSLTYVSIIYPLVVFSTKIPETNIYSLTITSLLLLINPIKSMSVEKNKKLKIISILILSPILLITLKKFLTLPPAVVIILIFTIIFLSYISIKSTDALFFLNLIVLFPYILLYYKTTSVSSLINTSLAYTRWLFTLLSPLWFYIGVSILYKLIKNAKTITNALSLLFPDRGFKLFFLAIIFINITFLILTKTDTPQFLQNLSNKLFFTLKAMGYVSAFILAYIIVSCIKKLEISFFELFFSYSLIFFIVYEYYFEFFSFSSSRLSSPFFYGILSFSILFLFLKIGLSKIRELKKELHTKKHLLLLMASSTILISVYFSLTFLTGSGNGIKELFFYFFVGMIQTGIPFSIYIFVSKKEPIEPQKITLTFVAGYTLALFSEAVKKIIKYGGLNPALNSSYKFVNYSLKDLYISIFFSLFFVFLMRITVFKNEDCKKLRFLIFFVFSGMAVGTFNILGFPFLPSKVEKLFISPLRFIYLEHYSLLLYLLFITMGLIPLLLEKILKKEVLFFIYLGASGFLVGFLEYEILKNRDFFFLNSYGWKIVTLLILLSIYFISRKTKATPLKITSLIFIFLIFLPLFYSIQCEKIEKRCIKNFCLNLPLSYKNSDFLNGFIRYQDQIPFIIITKCHQELSDEKTVFSSAIKNRIILKVSSKGSVYQSLYVESPEGKCIKIKFINSFKGSGYDIKRIVNRNFRLNEKEKKLFE